ncbi:hypothetical protein DUI70_4582 [Streptomyces albus]|nr:hypothetical protein DUI70_4582 [Streptomyces albus]
MRLMESGAPELEDEQLRAALDQLSGADLMVEPGEYLHGKEDYQAWADQLSSSEAK